VVATGLGLRKNVLRRGFEHIELVLSEESNTGLIRPGRQAEIEASFRATRQGWVSALMEQAECRVDVFLWHAEEVAKETLRILDAVQPTCVLAVQLSFAAVAALLAVNAPFVTFVTGHPTQLVAKNELYGYPYSAISMLCASEVELIGLRNLCADVQVSFTEKFNSLMHSINPTARALTNGLAAASPHLVLFNYPEQLMAERKYMFPNSVFIGSAIRNEHLDPALEQWLMLCRSDLPTVYFSFGSYFSVRSDVLFRVADALKQEELRVVFAAGLTDPSEFGSLPDHWIIRPYFPQVAVFSFCDVVVCHGGNNTVTEALTAGLSLVVAPFASDQFGNAATIEQHRLGSVFDPNSASVDDIRTAVRVALAARPKAASLGKELRTVNGPEIARHFCEEALGL